MYYVTLTLYTLYPNFIWRKSGIWHWCKRDCGVACGRGARQKPFRVLLTFSRYSIRVPFLADRFTLTCTSCLENKQIDRNPELPCVYATVFCRRSLKHFWFHAVGRCILKRHYYYYFIFILVASNYRKHGKRQLQLCACSSSRLATVILYIYRIV